MAKNDSSIISHWYQLYEGFQESPKLIYDSIQEAVAKRQLSNTSTSSVHYFEGGPLSAQREYLRVSRGNLFFDICAAHFGTGMFVSWWLSKERASKGIWILLAALFFALLLLYLLVDSFGLFLGLFLEMIVLFSAFITVGMLVQKGSIRIEDTLLEVPILGAIYDRLFHPMTYYKEDTALMFQESIRLAVNEVLDNITAAKGLKALTDNEKKPIMNDLLRR